MFSIAAKSNEAVKKIQAHLTESLNYIPRQANFNICITIFPLLQLYIYNGSFSLTFYYIMI